jgi:hypothetical protein
MESWWRIPSIFLTFTGQHRILTGEIPLSFAIGTGLADEEGTDWRK